MTICSSTHAGNRRHGPTIVDRGLVRSANSGRQQLYGSASTRSVTLARVVGQPAMVRVVRSRSRRRRAHQSAQCSDRSPPRCDLSCDPRGVVQHERLSLHGAASRVSRVWRAEMSSLRSVRDRRLLDAAGAAPAAGDAPGRLIVGDPPADGGSPGNHGRAGGATCRSSAAWRRRRECTSHAGRPGWSPADANALAH